MGRGGATCLCSVVQRRLYGYVKTDYRENANAGSNRKRSEMRAPDDEWRSEADLRRVLSRCVPSVFVVGV